MLSVVNHLGRRATGWTKFSVYQLSSCGAQNNNVTCLANNEMIVAVLGTNEQRSQKHKILPQLETIFPKSYVLDGVGSDSHPAIQETAYRYLLNKGQGLLMGRGTRGNTRKAIAHLDNAIHQLLEGHSGSIDNVRIRIFLLGMSRGCISVYQLMRHFSQAKIKIKGNDEGVVLKPDNVELVVNLIDPVNGFYPDFALRWTVPDNVVQLSVYYALLERRFFFGHKHLIVNSRKTDINFHYFLGAHSDLHGRINQKSAEDAKVAATQGDVADCLSDIFPVHARYIRTMVLRDLHEQAKLTKPGLLKTDHVSPTSDEDAERYVSGIASSVPDLHQRQGWVEFLHAYVSWVLTRGGLGWVVNRQYHTLDRSAQVVPDGDLNFVQWMVVTLGAAMNWPSWMYCYHQTLEQQAHLAAAKKGDDFLGSLYQSQSIMFYRADRQLLPTLIRGEDQVPEYAHFDLFHQKDQAIRVTLHPLNKHTNSMDKLV